MKVYNVNDPEFHDYGRVLTGCKTTQIIKAMQKTECPADHTIYVASDPEIEKLSECAKFQEVWYGELPVQVGYCNGFNLALNGLEYHRSSEINIAATDLILLLGRQTDITDDFHYNTSGVRAFLVPKGTAIEVYATTLHYAPCSADGKTPFLCVVILPKGTNGPLTEKHAASGEDRLLAANNKWLLAHKDAHIEGAWNGLVSDNITLNGHELEEQYRDPKADTPEWFD